MGTEKEEFIGKTIAKQFKETVDHREDISITIDYNNNIRFKSKYVDIIGGPGATEIFHKAMIEESDKLKDNI